MEYRVKTKEKCFYQNVLYQAGEEFIFQAETENDLPDYVQVVSETAEKNSAPVDTGADTGTEENTQTGNETKQAAGETKNKESPAKKAKNKK